jgi:hypothetical protein
MGWLLASETGGKVAPGRAPVKLRSVGRRSPGAADEAAGEGAGLLAVAVEDGAGEDGGAVALGALDQAAAAGGEVVADFRPRGR